MNLGRAVGTEFDAPGEAQDDFVLAVRIELKRRRRGGDPWALGQRQPGETPSFFGLLSVQVLAVYEMHDGIRAGSNALWVRLAQLLGREFDQMALQNEIYAHQQSLWRDGLQYWANYVLDRRCGEIRLPRDEGHRHVRLPKSQALLRKVDLESLEDRFQYLRWRPGDVVEEHSVLGSLISSDFKTAHGRQVWEDTDRWGLAARQVMDFVRYDWVPLAERRKMETVRSQGSRCGSRAWLYLSEEHNDRHKLRSGVLVPDGDGVLVEEKRVDLRNLLGDGRVLKLTDLAYEPVRRDRIVAVLDEEIGHYFVEQLWAAPGDNVIVVVPAARMQSWWSSANTVVADGDPVFCATREGRGDTEALPDLPHGWACLRLQIARTWAPSNDLGPWSSIIRARLRVKTSGGLKLGRSTWLAGAGPFVTVEGAELPETLSVNGGEFPVDENGALNGAEFQSEGAFTIACQYANRVAFRVKQSGRIEGEFADVPCIQASDVWLDEGVLNADLSAPAVSGPLVLGEWAPLSQGQTLPGELLRTVQALRWGKPLYGPLPETKNSLINALVLAGKGRIDGGR